MRLAFRPDTGVRSVSRAIAGRVIRLPTPARYSVAVAAAITAIVLRLSFDPLWGVKLPYITHFPAIMVAAWLGGLGPGILTTLITAAATQYFWIEPTNSWRVTETSELIGLLVFLAVGVVISALNDAWRSGATALSESEDRLRVTLTSIGDAIITTDERGCVTRLNPVAEQLTGWSAAEATAKPLHEVLVILNEEDRQPAQNSVDELLSSGVVSGFANHTVLVARDGREVPIDNSVAPIRTTDGRMVGAVMVFRDVTDRRRIERERSSLIADLETALHARDDFLSIASHELRNPVNAMQLQLAGVLREIERGDGDALKREWLGDRIGQAHGQVKRLTRLIDNLLDVSRITAGAIVLEPEDVDFREVVLRAVEHFSDELKPNQAMLHLPAEPIRGHWDPVRLEQVLTNLLSNAIKYGAGRPIELSLRAESDAVRLSVADHGIGIKPDEQPRLFARFERAVSGRQYGGFGLGLWITKRIVEAMHGTIAVESRPGEGSTFVVVLPRGSQSARTGLTQAVRETTGGTG